MISPFDQRNGLGASGVYVQFQEETKMQEMQYDFRKVLKWYYQIPYDFSIDNV